MHVHALSGLTVILYILHAVASAPASNGTYSVSACRYLPGDAAWPSDQDWANLNATIGGRLIRGSPLAKSCYTRDFDNATCIEIQGDWDFQTMYYEDPVNVMSPYWLNNSCSPFLGPNGTCTLGNIASYAINISNASTVVAGIQFAREKNIRLTVRNTGHDILGRSTGEGSLALWTHNLKDTAFINYTSLSYNGSAAKVGAGVQVLEVYKAASEHGLRVVGGGCPTVGLAGGWLPGGGHGPLTSAYGLGADNALEFEVVTVNGSHLVASPTQNADLYWALSGGGPGNYAVVLSITLRAFPDGPVVGSAWSFSNTDANAYWSAIEAWLKHLLVLDAMFPKLKTATTFTDDYFVLDFATFPDATVAELAAALDPFLQELQELNIKISANETILSENYVEHYEYFTTTQYINNETVGNRLIPRSLVENNVTELVDTIRGIMTNSSAVFVFVATNVTFANVGITQGHNSVLPAWRDALFLMNFGLEMPETASWDQMQNHQVQVNQWQDIFKGLTPGGGGYLNEATFDNPDWKLDYFGVNYDRLNAIKTKYDPEHLLWANAAVGSDVVWETTDEKRLCRRT